MLFLVIRQKHNYSGININFTAYNELFVINFDNFLKVNFTSIYELKLDIVNMFY